MNKKSNIIIKVGAIVVSIVILFTIYFVITKNRLPKSIEFYSFDKKSSIVIGLDSNIKSYSFSYQNRYVDILFKNRNDIINFFKKNDNYYDVIEYKNGNREMTKIILYKDSYFYSIKVYEEIATLENYVVDVGECYDYFPFVTNDVYIIANSTDSSEIGEITKTIEELNNYGNYISEKNLFSNYFDIKELLLKTNNEYYQFDDENKIIKIKLYSLVGFENGTNIADGYPVTVEFIENETKVKISVDLSVFD